MIYKYRGVLFSLVIIFLNVLIGHFFAPNGIVFTPFVIVLISIIIGIMGKEISPVRKSLILAGIIMLHDIGMKLYAGGSHDGMGVGWMNLMLIIGSVPAYIIIVIATFKYSKTNSLIKWKVLLLFPLIIWIHLILFGELGVVNL